MATFPEKWAERIFQKRFNSTPFHIKCSEREEKIRGETKIFSSFENQNLILKIPTMYDLTFMFALAENENTDTTSFTVTIIDDDPMQTELLTDYLHSMNIKKIESFFSGEEFFKVMKKGDERLILLDYDFGNKSKLNGITVLQEIRKCDPNIPIIMLSAQDDMNIALETIRLGALDYFNKNNKSSFANIISSIIKINELIRLKQTQKENMLTGIMIAVVLTVMVCLAITHYL